MDKLFKVTTLNKTINPQQLIYQAMHQDYSIYPVADSDIPEETKCGEIVVKRLLKGNRGHYGCLEHPSITFNCQYFPHSVMQQARTHRIGTTFDVQCLGANTEITFVNIEGETSPRLKKTIGELYDLWTNGEKAIRERSIRGRNGEPPGEYRHDCKNRIRKMRLRVLNEETGEFTTGSIKDVMCSGVQPVYRLTLEDGKTLDCTVNHRLLTDKGWQTMGDAVGLIVDSRGNVIKMTGESYLMCNGQTVIEEKKKLIAHPVKIVNVEYLGEQITYDIEVEGKWHNFVANGLVVHNSFRYTSDGLLNFYKLNEDDDANKINDLVESLIYLRPIGYYKDRSGNKYYYSTDNRNKDLEECKEAIKRYCHRINYMGQAPEQARGLLPFDYRQHFVVTFNLRSCLHFLDLRYKKDAQLEIQELSELFWLEIKNWVPEIAEWYEDNRLGKGQLAP